MTDDENTPQDPADPDAPKAGDGFILAARGERTSQAPDIPDYEITGRLGEGGMGVVWRGVQTSTGREVALKLLPHGMFATAKARAYFQREVELAARLEHPNIASVYDSGLLHGGYYYAMELVPGVHLDEYIKEQELGQRETLGLVAQVCRAVEHAHQRGIIHRDLKPSNILVTDDGQPHLVDFSLAKAVAPDEGGLTVSADGHMAGTPIYMSPEQAAGRSADLDTRTDVYSLGVMLFRLLAGRYPHDASGSVMSIARRIADEEPIRPRKVTKAIPKELETLLLKALAHEPDQRYASAGQLADDIDRYLAGEPLLARDQTLGYVVRKHVRKHWLPIAVVTTAVIGLSSLLLYGHLRIVSERNATVQQLAESLVSQGDALIRADRWDEAKARYEEALRALEGPGLDTFLADAGLWRTMRHAPSPLISAGRASAKDVDVCWERQLLAVATSAKDAELWDLTRGILRHRLRHFPAPADADSESSRESETRKRAARQLEVAFSPQGTLVLTLGNDGRVKLWDSRTGALRQKIAYARTDGQRSRHGRSLTLSGTRMGTFAPDGRQVLTAGPDGTVRFWDVETGRLARQWRPADWGPSDAKPGMVELSYDGRRLIRANEAGRKHSIDLWDCWTGERLARALTAPYDPSDGLLVLSPDGARMLCGQEQGMLKWWDLDADRQLQTLETRRPAFQPWSAIGITTDGGRALTSGDDLWLRLWDTSDGRLLRAIPMRNRLSKVRGSPQGRLAVSCASGYTLWALAEDGGRQVLAGHSGPALGAVFSRDGRLVASCGADHTVRVWDSATGRQVWSAVEHDVPVCSVGFSPDARHVVCGRADGTVGLWRLGTSRRTQVRSRPGPPVHSVAFAPDGHTVLCASRRKASIWNVRRRRRIYYCTNIGPSAALSPDGRLVAVATTGTIPQVYERTEELGVPLLKSRLPDKPPRDRIGKAMEVTGVAFSSDGRYLAHGNQRGEVRLWRVADRREIRTFAGRPGPVRAVAFSPDGRWILSAGGDKTLTLWSVTTGQALHTFEGHAGAVRSVVFSPDGRRLLSAADDGAVMVWNLDYPKRHRRLETRLADALDVLQRDPRSPAAQATLGRWYALRSQWNWAVQFLESARRQGEPVSALVLGRCYWRADRLADAQRQLQNAFLQGEAPAFYLRLCLNAREAAASQASRPDQ